MKFELKVTYKSGGTIRIEDLSALQLRCELADRIADNNKEESVEFWEIRPVKDEG